MGKVLTCHSCVGEQPESLRPHQPPPPSYEENSRVRSKSQCSDCHAILRAAQSRTRRDPIHVKGRNQRRSRRDSAVSSSSVHRAHQSLNLFHSTYTVTAARNSPKSSTPNSSSNANSSLKPTPSSPSPSTPAQSTPRSRKAGPRVTETSSAKPCR